MSEKKITTKLPPTLIIGLGGTGCDIVSRVDKLSNDEQRQYMRFVYFDTDANELRIRKNESPYIYTVQTSRRMTVGQALRSDREARENSFPTSNQLLNKPLTEGAGQVRAVSKLAFDACLRDGRMAPLHEAISELQRLNGDTLEQSMRVVIVTTLVGGTGSGILLPVSMYLRNHLENICQEKPIMRGVCVLPDVFFHGGNKTEVEKNNLRANAYATLRELDAFMLKADSVRGGAYDGFTLKMPTPGTVDDYDDYAVNPLDFCFLYDGLNMDGSSLHNFESYKQHVADCVFASSVSMLNKRLNSSEDNTILSRCAENGRNRYCGFGTSKIVYPFESVRDYIAMQWMSQAMSEDWLRYDKAYEEKMKQHQASRKKGVILPPIDQRDFYCKMIESDYSQKNPMALSIYDQCHIKDADGIDYVASAWNEYYRNLIEFISKEVSDGSYDEGTIEIIESGLGGIADGRKVNNNKQVIENYHLLAPALKKYFSKTRSHAERTSGIIADGLFSPANYDAKNKQHIEYFLQSEGAALHPNAARYFLYHLAALFTEALRRLNSNDEYTDIIPNADGDYDQRCGIAALESRIRLFFEVKKYEGKSDAEQPEKTNITEYVDSLDLRHIFHPTGEDSRNEWADAVDKIYKNCSNHYNDIKQYYRAYLEHAILTKALEHIDTLCKNYEFFFSQIGNEIKRIPRRMERIEDAYPNNIGNPVLYACASKSCLEGLSQRCPNVVDSIVLTDEFREEIFTSIYKTLAVLDPARQAEMIKELVTERIIAFWREQVVLQYGHQVDMDVIDAMRTEAEIAEGIFDLTDQVYYIRGKYEEAMKLASPFIDRPIGIEPYIIEAYSLGADVPETDDLQKSHIIQQVFSAHETDELMDKYQMLFMKALYNIRVTDLPKFAPADDCDVDPREKGSYYRAYWKRIDSVIPNNRETRVLTPHLDKRWHYVGVMPDLADKSEELCLIDAHRAFFISVFYGQVKFEDERYKFIDENGETVDDQIIVGDGRCNKLSEVYEAMLMSRPLVLKLLKHYENELNKEKSGAGVATKEYTATELYKTMLETKSKPYQGQALYVQPDRTLSFLELPILYKIAAGSCARSDKEATKMMEHMLDFIEEYLGELYCDPLDCSLYFVKWVHEQTKLLCDNLRIAYSGFLFDPFDNPLIRNMKNILKKRIERCETRYGDRDSVKAYLAAWEKNFADDTNPSAAAEDAETVSE